MRASRYRYRILAAFNCLRGRPTAYRVCFWDGSLEVGTRGKYVHCSFNRVHFKVQAGSPFKVQGMTCQCHDQVLVELPDGWCCPVDLTVQLRYGRVPDGA